MANNNKVNIKQLAVNYEQALRNYHDRLATFADRVVNNSVSCWESACCCFYPGPEAKGIIVLKELEALKAKVEAAASKLCETGLQANFDSKDEITMLVSHTNDMDVEAVQEAMTELNLANKFQEAIKKLSDQLAIEPEAAPGRYMSWLLKQNYFDDNQIAEFKGLTNAVVARIDLPGINLSSDSADTSVATVSFNEEKEQEPDVELTPRGDAADATTMPTVQLPQM